MSEASPRHAQAASRFALLLVALWCSSGAAPGIPAAASPSPSPLGDGFWHLPVVEQLGPRSLVPSPDGTLIPVPPEEDFVQALEVGGRGLGSLSIGRANRGALFNGVQLQDGPGWHVQ